MDCPHCSSSNIKERNKKTKLGYQIYFCNNCNSQYNERTGTPFNRVQLVTETIFEVVLWRIRYKLSLRDLAEMFLGRGIAFSHEAVREWEEKFAPLLTDELKSGRLGKAGMRWRVDETMLKIAGAWHYLYRAIDTDGKLVDVRLSKVRDKGATEAFFKQAVETVGHKPTQVTSDKEVSYPKAINKVLGRTVEHRTSQYLNNKIEQDHRAIKERYYPMRGFKTFESTERFCQIFEEQREYFRFRHEHKAEVSLPLQRVNFTTKFEQLKTSFLKKKMVWQQTVMQV